MEILDDQNVVFEFTESSINAIISLGVTKSQADLYVAELAAKRHKIKLAVDICEGYVSSPSPNPKKSLLSGGNIYIYIYCKLILSLFHDLA